jgi:hypothetical protein
VEAIINMLPPTAIPPFIPAPKPPVAVTDNLTKLKETISRGLFELIHTLSNVKKFVQNPSQQLQNIDMSTLMSLCTKIKQAFT